MSSIPYEPMRDEDDAGPSTAGPIATIHTDAYQPLSTLPSPPDYSAEYTRSTSSVVVHTSSLHALPPGEAHQAQPHDLDHGATSHLGTLNLLAMSEIRLKTRLPMEIVCPHCYTHIVTMLVPARGVASYLLFVLLILCGCILGCCLIPLYWTHCLDIRHVCPHCGKLIGVSKLL